MSRIKQRVRQVDTDAISPAKGSNIFPIAEDDGAAQCSPFIWAFVRCRLDLQFHLTSTVGIVLSVRGCTVQYGPLLPSGGRDVRRMTRIVQWFLLCLDVFLARVMVIVDSTRSLCHC